MGSLAGRKNLYLVLPVLLFFASWEIVCRSLPREMGNLFPPFTKVLVETGRLILSGIMGDHILWSLMRVICGFLIGIVFGISTGFMMGYKDLIDRSLHPIIAFLYPIPALGWVPLLMVWLGIGEALPISVIAIHSFFPTCYNTRSGIKNIDQRMVKVARSMGAKGLTLATKVIIPLALPSIFSGLRLSSGGAFRVVIAAEMVAMPKGIGALLMRAESLIRVDIIVSCLFILSLMSVLFERIFLMLERKVLKNEKLSPDRSF